MPAPRRARPHRDTAAAPPVRRLIPRAAKAESDGPPEWDESQSAFIWGGEVSFRIPIATPQDEDGLLRIDARLGMGPWIPLLRGVGMLFREVEGGVLPPEATHQRVAITALRHSVRLGALVLAYDEKIDDCSLRRTLSLQRLGDSLEIRLTSPGGAAGTAYCGMALGDLGPESGASVPIPGLVEPLLMAMPQEGGEPLFLSAYFDRFQGEASAYPPGGAFYRLNSEGVAASISETFYVAVGADPLAPLPALDRPGPPYRNALTSRVALDIYSELPYREDAGLFKLLRDYGLDDIVLLYRNWAHFGYRRREPLHYPASLERGKNEEFRRMLADAEKAGWIVALREKFATVAADSPYFSEDILARWWDGQPRIARNGEQAIRSDQMQEFARLEATLIRRNYGTHAAFVDGQTAWNPESWHRQVDDSAGSQVRTEAQAVAKTTELLEYLRLIHEGPLVGSAGEGASRLDTYLAGDVEGVVRGPDQGRKAPLIVDYELREVRPKLVGIGAGSYRQFHGHPTEEPVDTGRVDWDLYRATTIAMGHAGYLGNHRIKPGPRGIPFPAGSAAGAVREYFLLRALQERYLDAAIEDIRYESDGELLPLREALRRQVDLSEARIRLQYAGGLTVWVNRSSLPQWIVGPEFPPLPPTGFAAATEEGTFFAFSALIKGQRTDYCRCPEYVFVDTRVSGQREVEGLATDGAAVVRRGEDGRLKDVLMVRAKALEIEGQEFRLSERGDVRFLFEDKGAVRLKILDSESGKPIHVTWPGPEESEVALAVLERQGDAWKPSSAQLQPTRQGPQLSRARPGAEYRVM